MTRTMVHLAIAALLSILGSGCIALPYVSPPLKVELNVGPAGGDLIREPTSAPREVDALTQLGVHVGVHPLGLVQDFRLRQWDIGVGYALQGHVGDCADNAPVLHAAYLEASYFPMLLDVDDDSLLRLGVFGRAGPGFLKLQKWNTGVTATVGVSFEFARWLGATPFVTHDAGGPISSGPGTDDDAGALGVAYGEGGFGVSLGAGYTEIATHRGWHMTFNVTFRLPASAGILVKTL